MAARLKYGPLLFGITVATLMTVPARAQDLPVNIPSKAAVSTAGNFYVWAEGPWGPVRSPAASAPTTMKNNSNDGIAAPPPPSGWDSVTVFGPPAADNKRGGIGYIFPDGTFSPALGSKARVEFGASQTTTSVGSMPGNHTASIGDSTNGLVIGGCAGCTGSLSTNYEGTRTSVKAASDFNVGKMTLTPSVSVYGGDNKQDFTPTMSTDPGGTMRWKDVGTSVGIDSKVDLAPHLALNVGGNVGVGNREASLTTNSAAPVTIQRNAAPLTANAEARLTYKPAEALELRGFGGVKSYDSALPGISSSSGGTPQIKYGPEAGLYVGAGATFRFQSKD